MPLRPRDLPAAYRREHGLEDAPKPKPRVPKEQDKRLEVERAPVEYRGGVLNGTLHLFARPREYNDGHSWQSKCGRRTSAVIDFEAEGVRCERCYNDGK